MAAATAAATMENVAAGDLSEKYVCGFENNAIPFEGSICKVARISEDRARAILCLIGSQLKDALSFSQLSRDSWDVHRASLSLTLLRY